MHKYLLYGVPFLLSINHLSAATGQVQTKSSEKISQFPADFRLVAKKAIPSVISVRVQTPQKPYTDNIDRFSKQDSFGFFNDEFWRNFFDIPENSQSPDQPVIGQASGFIVSEDGYILTNNHVVKNATQIIVTLHDGKEYPAKLIGKDANTDVAVLKIDAKNLPYLKLGNSAELEVGQWVAAIGNPLGLQASVTGGLVSATGRNNLNIAREEDFIQTDAAINHGNSGGPLLDLDGNVVGINTAIATSTGGYMGIGFAIPSNLVKNIMDQLISKGSVTRGFLGVTLQRIDQDLALAFELQNTNGALIAEISKNSPAEKAGLKQGDIILKYNGQQIDNISSFRNTVALTKPDTSLTLTVKRNGEMLQVPITIGKFPEEDILNNEKTTQIGIAVQNLTPELAQNLGYQNEQGVIVTQVDPKGLGALAGVKKGSLIVAINHEKVNSVEAFKTALDKIEQNKPILLLVKQGQITRFISLKVG